MFYHFDKCMNKVPDKFAYYKLLSIISENYENIKYNMGPSLCRKYHVV